MGMDRPSKSRGKRGNSVLCFHQRVINMSLEMLNFLMIVTFTAICLFIGRILTKQPVREKR
jgi:hypothetical protein